MYNFNIIITGDWLVGKSSIINKIFGNLDLYKD